LKAPVLKGITCFAVFILSTIMLSAGNLPVILSDTAKNELAVEDDSKGNEALTKKHHVKYPALFSGNEAMTLDYIERFAKNRRAYLLRTYQKGKTLFPKVVTILKKYDVPQEFKVLIALESGFNPNAVSSAGAVGYWQIMDPVAREYGLKIAGKTRKGKRGSAKKAKVIDERKNFNKSTYAAARYLKDRSRNLNNKWLLIAASYNWGVGNVWKAMQKCGKAEPTYWDIQKFLPSETRAYVMNFITLNVIFDNYDAFVNNTLAYTIERPSQNTEDDCAPIEFASN
jgi:membrane-bound lytic murein transglycosylase MltF